MIVDTPVIIIWLIIIFLVGLEVGYELGKTKGIKIYERITKLASKTEKTEVKNGKSR